MSHLYRQTETQRTIRTFTRAPSLSGKGKADVSKRKGIMCSTLHYLIPELADVVHAQ